MSWIALKMLTGNRGKYLGIILGVTVASFLIAQQASIFCGLMKMLTFPEGKEGNKIVAEEIADQDLASEAQLWRERMLESLYNYSNELM